MSEAEFTPGPWIVDHYAESVPRDGGLPCAIYAEDDNLIAGFDGTHHHVLKSEHAKQSHANAHLISAAPDLYEAMEGGRDTHLGELLGMIEDSGDEKMWAVCRLWMDQRDTALSKARGET
ncbi:MAG: hypothetical protein ACX94C_07885 [Phycisphaerales bacterium]